MEAVDAEVLGNLNETYRDLYNWEETHKNWFMFTRVLLLMATLFGIATSILIMYVIRRYPRLRTRINYYIFHMLLCNLIYSVVQSLFVSAYCIVFDTNYIPIEIMRVVWNFDETTVILVFVYSVALVLDWYANAYNKHSLITYQHKYYKFVICLLYLLATLKICLHLAIDVGFMNAIFKIYLVILLIVTGCNCWRCCGMFNKDEEPAYNMQVVNVVIYSYLPLMLYLWFDHMVEYTGFIEKIFLATLFLPQLAISCIPVTLFLVLRKRDNLFKAAFDITLHKKGHDYENSQLNLCEEEKV